MKKLSLILLSMLLIFTLAACGDKCEHTYDNVCDATCNECGEVREVVAHDYNAADCDTAKTCKICGATEGEALGHEWTTPDVDRCEVQSTCSRCGLAEGQNKEHNWVDANCSTPKTCSTCGKTDGEALGHTPNEDDGDCTTAILCKMCAEVTSAGKTSHDPEADDGNCTTEIKCKDCGKVTTEAKSHTPNADDDDCTTAITCKDCGKVTTAGKTSHTPNEDDGNCTTAITCKDCGKVTTAAKTSHTPSADDGDCTTPIKCTECATITTEAKAHDHTGEWQKDASGHWHVCKNDGCSVTDTKADHISDGAATEEKAEKCAVCEYVITPELEHTHKHNIPKYDAENHWIECACGDKSAVTAHTANADDGDCTTAVTCSGCAHIMTAAKAHTPNADDGDCTTDITCKDCGKVTTAGYKEHTPNADDGDCTTAITCQYCDVVTTEARSEHTGGTATCLQGAICTVCEIEYTEKDSNNHATDKYTYINSGGTTHKKIHECNAIVGEETHTIDTSEEITYTWSDNYASCTAEGICSVCESSVIEAVSSTDAEKHVSAIFTIVGLEEQRFNKTTIFFNTDGGTDIAPIVQLCGTKVTPPTDPNKPGFRFVGWDKDIPTTMPLENITVTANWEAITYTVLWVDENGTVLERDEGLSYGATPAFNGQKPYKAATTEYSYIFKGWTPSVGSVTDNTTYTAVYESIKIEVLEGCTYKKGDVVFITPSSIKYCNGCGKLINNSVATITGLRGMLDGTPVYWITYHCCGHKSNVQETAIVGKK